MLALQGSVVAGENDNGVAVEPETGEFVEKNVGGPVDARHSRAVFAVRALVEEPILDVDREVHVHVGEVEEERPGPVLADEAERLLEVALGKGGLIGLGLDHLFVEHERQRRILLKRQSEAAPPQQLCEGWEVIGPVLAAHVVAVREPEVAVEAVPCGQELGLVATVPLAHQLGGVAGVAEERGDRDLGWVQAEFVSREQHREAAQCTEPDTRRIASGEHRGA